MNRNKIEMIIFLLIAIFTVYSGRLDPKLSLTITGILIVGLMIYNRTNSKK